MYAWKIWSASNNISQNRHQNKYYSRQKGLSVTLKGSIQSGRSDTSVYVSKNRFSRYIHENLIELKAETDKATTIVRDSNTTFPGTNRPI